MREFLAESKGGTLTLTLNRPRALNSLTDAMLSGLADAVVKAGRDASVRFIVLAAAGRTFCAGADLKEMTKRDSAGEVGRAQLDSLVATCGKPVIAAIDGFCLAGGLELALRCDIRIATEPSTFGLP